MPNSVLNIKQKVKKYQDIITKKEELTKEYSDWLELYKEIKQLVTKLRKIYETEKTEEAKRELDKWLKEEKDYLEIINEYSDKFNEINSQLGTFDRDIIEEQALYLAKVTEYEQISKEMKAIEKRSKKAALGTSLILIPNAEGRNKKIDEAYAQDYINLCEEKKIIAKDIKILWNKVINQSDSNLSFTSLTEDAHYNSLSLEEKIVELEKRREQIRQASGIKDEVNSDGKAIDVPKQYIGLYVSYGLEIKKINKQIAENRKKYFEHNAELLNLVDDNKAKDITFMFDVIEYDEWHEEDSYDNHPGFMKIINIKKKHNKNKIKETVKKAVCFIAASAIVLTMISVGARKLKKVINNSTNFNNKPETTMVSKVPTSEPQFEEEKTENKNESNIVLGDSFSVRKDAKIYKSMYDATLERNSLLRYDVSDNKTIGGIAVNYEGELYFFYATDIDAQKNIDLLLASGGKVTAILGANPYGYEGFYNINDVKVLDKSLGGTSR